MAVGPTTAGASSTWPTIPPRAADSAGYRELEHWGSDGSHVDRARKIVHFQVDADVGNMDEASHQRTPREHRSVWARVLLIDDDPTFCKLACSHLERAGHRVSFHPGTFGVMEAVRREPFDVILVDMRMPYIDGPHLLGLLRRRGLGRSALVLVSAATEEEVQTAAAEHGADLHFCKDWGLDRLADLVGAMAPSR
jgi:CheY-like chemotaxis protein